jgi:alanine racemase
MVHGPNSVRIDLSALVHNLGEIEKLTADHARIMGIVKSDAYGHGLLHVSRTLEESHIDCLGVAHLHEALELRQAGIRARIVLLCSIQTRDESRQAVENDLTPVLFDMNMAEVLAQESVRRGKVMPIHLKIDTGMGRLGIPHTEIAAALEKIKGHKGLKLEALASHLSCSDESEKGFTRTQIDHFRKSVALGRSLGFPLDLNHLANSGGIMNHRESHFEMVRPGIMLYGGLPSPEFQSPVSLRPAMHFTGKIIQIRELPANAPVSYGRTYYTKDRCRIAVLSAGYGDGLPRSMSNRGEVLIRGKRAPIVGTICMNLITCDVSHLEEVRPGDEVVFMGSQGDQAITADDIARWAGTISYEIFCSIGQRNPREYMS